MSALLIAATPLLPMLLAPMLFARGGARWIALVPWVSAPAVGLAVLGVTEETAAFPWLLTGMVLGLDATSHVFLLATALLWFVAGWYARGDLAHDPARARFFGFFCLAESGNVGAVVALDVVSFYLFFAVMTFSIYGLIVHRRSRVSRRAGAVYLTLAVLGEAALLVAFLLIVHADGTSIAKAPAAVGASVWRDPIIGLLLIGFGAKIGVLGLHVSLPLAYDAAPTPGAAVMAGAMIKAAVLGWLRFLPLGEQALSGWAAAFIGLGLAAALYGVLIGLCQRRLKVILAYSSISQMGLVTAGVGFGLAAAGSGTAARASLALYALHHALVKGALFLGVGVLSQTRGPARLRLFAGLALLALVLSGAPLTSGALAKYWLKELAMLTPWANALASWLVASTIATTLLMVHFLDQAAGGQRTATVRRGLVPAWVLAVAATVVSAWLVPPVAGDPTAVLAAEEIAGAAWPVLVGLFIALAIRRLAAYTGWRLPTVPPGDVLLPIQWALQHGVHVARVLAVTWGETRDRLAVLVIAPGIRGRLIARVAASAVRVEMGFRIWSVVGLALFLLLGLLLWFFAFETT